MEITVKLVTIVFAALFVSCVKTSLISNQITDVYVADFGSDDIESCRPSDVDLDKIEAKEFFSRGRQVDHKIIHDHYHYAPCYIEGTLKYETTVCQWQIRAGATGYIKCGKETKYYVCDTCEDLFQ